IDPYNDFISEGGKIWPRIKAVAEANNCVPHMQQVLNAARKAKLLIFFAMHHRYRPGDYETWTYIAKNIRVRHVGWRVPSRVRAGARRNCCPGALVLQRLR